ncbi:uncharacterized protein [Rutidosis leptorrhynchoides]|uniref:uncharacterized protein n=1 Tax=Rutidosis leptorrhynchoides TaxID=125765 RepID=UPI003A9A5AC1
MANLKEADSPLCRRIVLSFLDFLNSVEPSSGSDKDSLQVAKDSLSEAFKIDSSSTESVPKSDSLLQIFNSKNPEAPQTLNAVKEKKKKKKKKKINLHDPLIGLVVIISMGIGYVSGFGLSRLVSKLSSFGATD